MILTVTLNPSIDISYPLEALALDRVNRVEAVQKQLAARGLMSREYWQKQVRLLWQQAF